MFLQKPLLVLSLLLCLVPSAWAQQGTTLRQLQDETKSKLDDPLAHRRQDDTTLIDDTNVKVDPQGEDETKQELYAKLEKRLTNTRWVGNFTVTGQDLSKLTPEEYQILSAKKLDEGEYWSLKVRIKYGKNDMTLPMPPMEILWAGRSPVITVDRLTVPGLGTFDARVIIRGDKYAGTWAHDEVGGHLFGTIEALPDEAEETKSDDKEQD